MRNLATLRNDGTQIAASAASKIRSDSAPVRQREIGWPNSRHIISGTVPPITAPHATTRGNKSADGGAVGVIGLADIAADPITGGPVPGSTFSIQEFRQRGRAAIPTPPGCNRETSGCL